MILCYITDRCQCPGDFFTTISNAMEAGVDYIQLREKDLPAREQEDLALRLSNLQRETATSSRLLVNSRADVALAVGAQGVHLPAHDLSPMEIRRLWPEAVIGVSCHSRAEVDHAASEGADFAVFGPVFEKGSAPPLGLAGLREACRSPILVLALGGVTLANAKSCLDAGAAGIAGIRLFQEGNLAQVVAALRHLSI